MTKDEAKELWAQHHKTCPICLNFSKNLGFFCSARVQLYADLQWQLVGFKDLTEL